jgi:DNA replication protein DnaC
MSQVYEEKALAYLEQLGLSVPQQRLDAICQHAAAQQWSYSHFLGYLLEAEVQERHRRTVQRNVQFARFPAPKRLEAFDFAAQPSLDRRLIDELATGRFVYEGRNLVLLGPPGVGKTHLAIGLGMMTCELGHRVYFTNALEMARKLTLALEQNRLHRQLNALTQPKLLILDEVGYLKMDATQASLLFQVICQRYEKNQALVLTSNKAWSEWGEVFGGDLVMASAALDRLLHRCTVLHIRGESYRLRERKSAGLARGLVADSGPDTPSREGKQVE